MLLVKAKYILSNEPESDEESIKRAKKDPKAFEVLYKKYFKEIFRFVHKKIHDDQETADLVSKVFIKSFQGIDKFQYNGIPYSAWLYRVAINETNQYFRKSKTRHVVLDERLNDSLAIEMDFEESKTTYLDQLPYVINELNPNELELIELRFYEGMSFKQIGTILDMTETNSRVKTYRVIQKLKRILSHE